jgi:hypothetical protein
LNRRTRCGCRPCACQIRCTDEILISTALAIRAAVRWAFRKADHSSDDSLDDRWGREACGLAGWSCRAIADRRLPHEPLLPAPHDGFGAPVARIITLVPRPSTVSRMIFAARRAFAGCSGWPPLLGGEHNRAVTLTMIPLRMAQLERPGRAGECLKGVERQDGGEPRVHKRTLDALE